MRTIQNRLLALRYNHFQKCIKPIQFPPVPDWKENFDNPQFSIVENNFYAGHSYCSKDCVEIKEDGLHLKVQATDENRFHWDRWQQCSWKIGWVEYHDMFPAYGTWVWKAIVPENSFSALWMLRKRYCPSETRFKCRVYGVNPDELYLMEVPMYNLTPNMWVYDQYNQYLGRVHSYDSISRVLIIKDHDHARYSEDYVFIGQDAITPEVDIMELLNNGKFGHTLHYGFEYGKYATDGSGTQLKAKNLQSEHEFAVVISPDKYKFYIDGYFTGIMKTGLSPEPINVIMNNAVHSANFTTKPEDFIIKEFKYYERYE
jgi:hypothetical protein